MKQRKGMELMSAYRNLSKQSQKKVKPWVGYFTRLPGLKEDREYKQQLLQKHLLFFDERLKIITGSEDKARFILEYSKYFRLLLHRLSSNRDTQTDIVRYITLTKKLPLPSRKQIENFIEYISGAHSWYKDLPQQPNASMKGYIFLNQYAGYLERHESGITKIFPIKSRKECFHYSQMPTIEYRKRFGYLSYAFSDSPGFIAFHKRNAYSWEWNELDNWYFLPKEIITFGVPVSANIHEQTENETVRRKELNALIQSAIRTMRFIKKQRFLISQTN